MRFRCPRCEHAIILKGVNPGKYTTKCPKCATRISVVVPKDSGENPSVRVIGDTRSSEAPPGDATHRAADASAAEERDPAAIASAELATGEWSATPKESVVDENATAVLPRSGAGTAEPGADPSVGFGAGEVAANALRAPASDAPSRLGGYQIVGELGRGGMGAVYLARQVSLDRQVALKVMKPQWSQNATFVARFTREAYAAAQLVHHNIVQIYDFGEDGGTSFFSMEFVDGKNLSQLIREKTKLDVEEAAGYVLQAARGLKFAHDQSMVHRDVKPENLLINRQGVVKVADLGLVKTPESVEGEQRAASDPAEHPSTPGRATKESASSRVTRVDAAMGTPAFMAPEQARDAANVDHRADIYSLGCTLYDLVTGRPPFQGGSAAEIMTKHASEPITPPDRIVKRVPKELSEIVLRMMAKEPVDRYNDLDEVIAALEAFLGIRASGPFTPKEEHADLLEQAVAEFNKAPAARMRPKVIAAVLGGCLALALLFALLRRPFLASGSLGLCVLTGAAYFLIHGHREKSALFLRTRGFVMGGKWTDWLTAAAALVLITVLLAVFGLLWAWLAFAAVAVLIALGLHLWLDRKAQAERAGSIARVESLLRSLRLHGLDEDAIQQFVCKYSGANWEAFFETLFGYDAKLAARRSWGQGTRSQGRRKHEAWRDPLIAWIDAKEKERKDAREKAVLRKIEEKSLVAQGENLVTARRKADRAAEAMVTVASELRAESARRAAAERKSDKAFAKAIDEAARKAESVLVSRERGLIGRRGGPLDMVFGPRPRFLVGAALVAGCLLWMHQNGIVSGKHLEQLKAAAQKTIETKDAGALTDLKELQIDTPTRTEPLKLPAIPRAITRWFDSFNPGVAGFILIASAFFRGSRMSLFAAPAAAIALFGPAFAPARVAGIDSHYAAMALGGAVFAVGLALGRRR